MDNERLDEILKCCIDSNVMVYDCDAPQRVITKRLFFYMKEYALNDHEKQLTTMWIPNDVYPEVDWFTYYMDMKIIPCQILSTNGGWMELIKKHNITLMDGYNAIVVGEDMDNWTVVGCCRGYR